jgi:hypothetical protein
LQPKALTPCFWLVKYQAAASHTRKGAIHRFLSLDQRMS